MEWSWKEYWRRVKLYLSYRPEKRGDFWRRFGFLLVWPFNIASFVLGTVGSLLLIDQFHITTLWLAVTVAIVVSLFALLLLQGILTFIDELVIRARLPETPIAIFLLVSMTAGSIYIVYLYLLAYPLDTWIIGGSTASALALKIGTALLILLLKYGPTAVAWFLLLRKSFKWLRRRRGGK